MTLGKRRPICPECGSVDCVVSEKTATCNRCGFGAQRGRFFDYPIGGGTGNAEPHPVMLQEDRPPRRRRFDDTEMPLDEIFRRSA